MWIRDPDLCARKHGRRQWPGCSHESFGGDWHLPTRCPDVVRLCVCMWGQSPLDMHLPIWVPLHWSWHAAVKSEEEDSEAQQVFQRFMSMAYTRTVFSCLVDVFSSEVVLWAPWALPGCRAQWAWGLRAALASSESSARHLVDLFSGISQGLRWVSARRGLESILSRNKHGISHW